MTIKESIKSIRKLCEGKSVKKIKVTKGHLTQTNKKAIKAMFDQDVMEGRVGKIDYFIKNIKDNQYTVTIKQKQTVTIGKGPEITTDIATFEIN